MKALAAAMPALGKLWGSKTATPCSIPAYHNGSFTPAKNVWVNCTDGLVIALCVPLAS